MTNSQGPGVAMQQDLQAQITRLLGQMTNKVTVYLFVPQTGANEFSQVARQVIHMFAQMSPNVVFREFDLGSKEARQLGVENGPTIVFDPDRLGIRWLGAPVGEEGKTFIEILLLIGYGTSGLSDASVKIARKIETPRQIKVFVSPTCPYCPQQAVNAVKAAIENPEMISVELVDIQAFPEIADQYNAHSVPQTWANEVLIGMGAQAEEVFMQSLQKLEEQSYFIPETDAELIENDLVIVGGGPAGLTAAIYSVRSGLSSALIERNLLGGQMATTPVVENYPGFTSVGGKTLVDIMVNHALQYATIFQGEEVLEVIPGDPIVVKTNRRTFNTRAVLLATGANHRHLGVPGENRLSGRGVSYCATCDGPLFRGRTVILVGGGNSAVTEALHLNHIGVNVTLVHRRDTLRAQDTLVKHFMDSGIPVLWNSEVRQIRGQDRVESVLVYNNKTGEETEFRTDGVFISIGYEPAVELAKKVGVTLTDDGYIARDDRHRTNIAGIYSAGDVEGGYKQIVTAAGQGAEAAMAIFEDLINPYWKDKQS